MGTTVLDLIDAQAVQNPDGIASEYQKKTITNRALREASMRVAIGLHERGFQPRDRIPLVTGMGLDMVVAVLGILRLGACYCPIDSAAWSSSRVFATLEAVQSTMVFSTVDMALPGYEVVRLQDVVGDGKLDRVAPDNLQFLDTVRRNLTVSDLIYIIFTSGTTGKPKGVMIPHGSVAHLAQQDFKGSLTVYPGARVLLFFSVAFDGCAGIVFTTLSNGGTLAMASASDVLDVAPTCTTLIVTPSMLANLEPSPEFDQVGEIYLGGEAPTASLVEAWITPTRKVYNSYGPTECTTAVSVAEMKVGGPIILGDLVTGVELILLDDKLEEEVDEGEICIRGPCLAVGYLNNEKLTAERFFMRNGVRHYRTGDLARRSEAGLHFIARADRVVKNRGFLINLETEVEPALRSGPGVRQAAAFIHRGLLVGFVTPKSVCVQTLREHLRDHTDPFIIPDLLFSVPEFPLTSNGKVDSRRLADSIRLVDSDTAEGGSPSVSPSLDRVREGFAWVFGWPFSQIRPTTSFGALGGNSLRALKLCSFLRKHQLTIATGEVFTLDTVSAIARAVLPLQVGLASKETAEADDLSTATLTEHQAAMLRETSEVPSSNYMFYTLERNYGPKDLSPNRLQRVWEALFERHPILRADFDLAQNRMQIRRTVDFEWKVFTASSEEEASAASRRELDSLWRELRSCSAGRPLMLRPQFRVIDLPGEKVQVNWVIHHAYADAWSFGILLAEFERILDGEIAQLPPAPSFVSIARLLEEMKGSEKTRIERFWSDYSRPWPSLRPVALPSPAKPAAEPWVVIKRDSQIRRDSLDAASRHHGVSSAAVIYAAWALTLAQYTGTNTIGMKISVSGRSLNHPEADSVVGPLNGRCPLISEVDDTATASGFVQAVHRNFYSVNEIQWSYCEFRRQASLRHGTTYWFDTQIVVLLDVPVDLGEWRVAEVQKPTAPIWVGVVQKGNFLNIRLRIDGARYDAEAAPGMLRYFEHVLGGLLDATESTLVKDLRVSAEEQSDAC
ncbi:nonribosomal peptide synthetase 11 [Aspergillus recurvatus]